MDDVKNQLVKDVADLKQRVTELGAQLGLRVELTEERVREIAREVLEAAKPPLEATTPPLETSKKRPFELYSRGNKSQTPKKL